MSRNIIVERTLEKNTAYLTVISGVVIMEAKTKKNFMKAELFLNFFYHLYNLTCMMYIIIFDSSLYFFHKCYTILYC